MYVMSKISSARNKIACAVGALLCAICLVVGAACVTSPAYAEEFKGAEGWSVTFDGSGMNSNFKTQDMDDAVAGLQPGDFITFKVALNSTADFDTDWYMTNQVLRSLEDTQAVASDGGYTYRLAYINKAGQETVLYDSNVGGENEAKDQTGEGLHEATNDLEDYLFLDTLSTGDNGMVTLRVDLDGETQGNTYQDTMADLQMNFAVEKTINDPVGVEVEVEGDAEDDDDEEVVTTKRMPSSREALSTLAQTGDNLPPIWLLGGLAVIGLALMVVALVRMKRDRDNEGSE